MVAYIGLKVRQLYIGRWLGVAHTRLKVLQLYIGIWLGLGVLHTEKMYFSFILAGSLGSRTQEKRTSALY